MKASLSANNSSAAHPFDYPQQDVDCAFDEISLDATGNGCFVISEAQAIKLASLIEMGTQNLLTKRVEKNVQYKFGSRGDTRRRPLERLGALVPLQGNRTQIADPTLSGAFEKALKDKNRWAVLVEWAKAYRKYRAEEAQKKFGVVPSASRPAAEVDTSIRRFSHG